MTESQKEKIIFFLPWQTGILIDGAFFSFNKMLECLSHAQNGAHDLFLGHPVKLNLIDDKY